MKFRIIASILVVIFVIVMAVLFGNSRSNQENLDGQQIESNQ